MLPFLLSKVSRLSGVGAARVQFWRASYGTMVESQISKGNAAKGLPLVEDQYDDQDSEQNATALRRYRIGENVSRKDKINFLVNTLLDLNDNKEAIYGTLDAWVAWEQTFPIASLKQALIALEKQHQWHRIIQVIKWMLSKGQGTTLGTYGQLIRALDMDHRAEEAHKFWQKRIGRDLHSVPWQLCTQMISIYYRNNMLESLVKLFKSLEAFDRKPPEKSIVQRVADAYELLGKLEEKERVLEKYKDLFTETNKGGHKKHRSALSKKRKTPGEAKNDSNSDSLTEAAELIQ